MKKVLAGIAIWVALVAVCYGYSQTSQEVTSLTVQPCRLMVDGVPSVVSCELIWSPGAQTVYVRFFNDKENLMLIRLVMENGKWEVVWIKGQEPAQIT